MKRIFEPLSYETSNRILAVSIAGFLGALLYWAGTVHIVYGSGFSLPTSMQKISWSLSETLVNADEVEALPGVVARIRYPLFTASLIHAERQDTERIKRSVSTDAEFNRCVYRGIEKYKESGNHPTTSSGKQASEEVYKACELSLSSF